MTAPKVWAKKALYSNALRFPYSKIVIPYLKKKIYAGHRRSFYVLSTGRVGTRLLHHCLGSASNAIVFHQPGPDLKETVVRDVVARYSRDRDEFKNLRVNDYYVLEEKLLRQMAYPQEVYGDTLNHMFPFGYMLYRYFGPEKVRLIHLIRNPIDCGRSILKAERDDTGHGRFEELRPPEFLRGGTPAEKTAMTWNGVNELIRFQFDLIDDPTVCKVVRLEDVTVDLIEGLFDFLGLQGFDPGKISALLADKSHDVRHSHLDVNPVRPDATDEELALIGRLCAPLAQRFGY